MTSLSILFAVTVAVHQIPAAHEAMRHSALPEENQIVITASCPPVPNTAVVTWDADGSNLQHAIYSDQIQTAVWLVGCVDEGYMTVLSKLGRVNELRERLLRNEIAKYPGAIGRVHKFVLVVRPIDPDEHGRPRFRVTSSIRFTPGLGRAFPQRPEVWVYHEGDLFLQQYPQLWQVFRL